MSISDGKNINLNYKDVDYSLLIDKSRIVYTNKLEDITIIEIKGNDPINIQIFLEIDDKIIFNDLHETFVKKKFQAYILHFELGEEAKYSSGIIKEIKKAADIKNVIIGYTCPTERGSSGGPIINPKNNKVFGIHIGYNKKRN